jgi:hypothetical protein
MPAMAPIDHAHRDGHQHRRQAHRQRDAPAVQHAREQVAAQVVGAQRMLLTAGPGAPEVDVVDADLVDQRAEQHGQHQQAQQPQAPVGQRWRLKRRQASAQGETLAGPAPSARALSGS